MVRLDRDRTLDTIDRGEHRREDRQRRRARRLRRAASHPTCREPESKCRVSKHGPRSSVPTPDHVRAPSERVVRRVSRQRDRRSRRERPHPRKTCCAAAFERRASRTRGLARPRAGLHQVEGFHSRSSAEPASATVSATRLRRPARASERTNQRTPPPRRACRSRRPPARRRGLARHVCASGRTKIRTNACAGWREVMRHVTDEETDEACARLRA